MPLATAPPSLTLSESAQKVLLTPLPKDKSQLTKAMSQQQSIQTIGPHLQPPVYPSRPPVPKIVPVTEMPKPKAVGVPSNIFYLHTLAHVELNAIDLCFDTFLRFRRYVEQQEQGDHWAGEWAEDWLSIAVDEARHYTMLSNRLEELGYKYGDLPAHSAIWDSAKSSETSARKRLALGQLVAEARGLDAGPKLAERLTGAGDNPSAGIVRIIVEEEVRHVEIGVKWFMRFCEVEQKEPIQEFREIALQHANPGAFIPPFNEERRGMAGLTPDWYLPVAEEIKRVRERQRVGQS